jgi:hypothetical protein
LIAVPIAQPEEPSVQITASAVSLNVADVPASAAFLTSHFGFRQEMAADGFASPHARTPG